MTSNTQTETEQSQPSQGKRIFGYRFGHWRDLQRFGRRLLGDMNAFPKEYFAGIYSKDDPYNYEQSAYDRLKRGLARYAVQGKNFRLLLDIGSGEGFMALTLRENAQAISLADISADALARARKRVGLPGDDFVGDALELLKSLPDNYCDGMVISDILYYLSPFPYSTYGTELRREVKRVLEKGGRLVLVHPHGWYVHAAFRADRELKRVHNILLKTYRSVRMEAFDNRSESHCSQ